MKLSDSLIKEILDFIGVTKEETKHNIPCPFGTHPNKTPNFNISLEKQVYNCFSCGQKGTLAFLYETLLDKEIKVDVESFEKNKHTLEISRESYLPRINFLGIEQLRQTYLEFIKERKILKSTYDLLDHYVDTDIDSNFYGYLCFLHDADDEFICGRTLLKGVEEKRPKYFYLKGIGRPMLGMSFIDYEVKHCILVEGIFDWFTLVQLGIKNVLCGFGTSVTRSELYKLVDVFSSCLICFDKDAPGFDGTVKVGAILKEFGIRYVGAYLPRTFGKDLNEALQRGLDMEIKEFIQDNLNALEFASDDAGDDFDQVKWLEANFNKNARKLKTMLTGLDKFDELIGGFTPGLVTLLGKTSQGKSALAIFLAVQLVKNNGCKVLYVTYEISMNQVWCRVLSIQGNHFWPNLEKDKAELRDEETEYLKMMGQVFHVRTSLNFEQIIKESKDYDLIFIDYIQVAPSSRLGNETEARRLEADFALMARYGQSTGKTFFVLSSISQADYGKTKNVSVKNSGGGDYSPYLTMVINREDEDDGRVFLKCYIQKNTKGIANTAMWFIADFAHNSFEETENRVMAS